MPTASVDFVYDPIMFGFIAMFGAVVVVVVLVAVVRRRRRPARSTEQRLRDLDDLRGRELITPEQYVKARSQVLSGH